MGKEVGIKELKRRDFIRAGLRFGAGAASLAAGYAAVPDIFAGAVYAAKQESVANDNILVMIQLAGGNDGLSTVIPIQDGRLRDLRPNLAAKDVPGALPLSADFGLNRNLAGIKKLWDQGRVAVVHGVGYPNPSYSHFESTRVWETADPNQREVNGWLGQALAKYYDTNGHPLTGCACGTTSVPGALRDLHATLTVVEDARSFGFQGGSKTEKAAGALYRGTPGIYGALFDTTIATIEDTIGSLRKAEAAYQSPVKYNDNPNLVYPSKTELGAALKLAASLVTSGTGVKILHVTLGGFDTHETEPARHDDLLTYLDQSVSAFYADLDAHGKADNVLVATWSEFGRRAQENSNSGTDHGAAAPMLLIGNPVKGGLYGQAPSLGSLVDGGNLKYTVDFRSVYQEIIGNHLGADAKEILQQSFDHIPFLKVAAKV